MRTTITLEPDVAHKLRRRMAERETSLKEVVNEALRRGLSTEDPGRPDKPFRVVPHSFGFKPGIDVRKLNQLLDELDLQRFVSKTPARKRQR